MKNIQYAESAAKKHRGKGITPAICRPLLWMILLWIPIVTAWECRPEAERRPQSLPLKLAMGIPTPYSGLIAIADEKGYFKESGVEVSMQLYPSGLLALEAVCRGEAQIATVTDLAFSAKMLEEPSVRVVASIGISVGSRIVARKDRNIHEPSDLKGKKVGFTPNTTSDYFLHSFLLMHSISPADLTAVPITSADQVDALLSGEVDAVSAFDQNILVASERLGENGVSWETQNSLGYHWLLAVMENLTRSPEVIKRFLRALIKAEHFVLTNEDEARAIILAKWNLDPEFMRRYWDQSRVGVSFNQSVVTSIQTFVKWRMQKDGKIGDPPPVVRFIYTGALDEIDPRLVTIFR